jgi:prepilin-type N-terminal cleavage/methylation domain-containing protein
VNDSDHGFTVVELLIAMTIIASAVVFLGSVVGFTRQY